MSPLEWYYARGKKQFGPVTSAELKMLADTGDLRSEELVWHEGMDGWAPASKVRGLFDDSATQPKLAETIGEPIPPPEPREASSSGGSSSGGLSPTQSGATPAAALAGAAAASAAAPASGAAVDTASAGIGPRGASVARPAGAAFERSSAAYERARESDSSHVFDVLLEAARQRLGGPFVNAAVELFAAIGHWGLYFAIGLTLMVQLALALESGSAGLAVLGLAAAFVLAVLQYAARRFVGGLDRLLRSSAGRLGSTAFLDCFALLHAIVGLAALLGLSVWALQGAAYQWIGPAIGLFIVMQYAAIVALNPETLNLVIASDASATEEALGVMTFLFKLVVKLAPICFGVGTAWGLAQLAYAGFLMIRAPETIPAGMFADFPLASLLPAEAKWQAPQAVVWSAVKTLAWSAAVPIVAYVGFLAFHILASVLGVILGLPSQLAALKGSEGKDA